MKTLFVLYEACRVLNVVWEMCLIQHTDDSEKSDTALSDKYKAGNVDLQNPAWLGPKVRKRSLPAPIKASLMNMLRQYVKSTDSRGTR